MAESQEQRELREARTDLLALKDKISAEKRERLDEFTRQLNAELDDRYGLHLKRAQQRVADAKEADDKHREQTAAERSPYPLGTTLHEWKDTSPTWSRHIRWEKTGVVGVVEVFKKGDDFPLNVSQWSLPDYGEVILRPRKKDGSPSKALHRLERKSFGYKTQWLPEGKTPEADRA